MRAPYASSYDQLHVECAIATTIGVRSRGRVAVSVSGLPQLGDDQAAMSIARQEGYTLPTAVSSRRASSHSIKHGVKIQQIVFMVRQLYNGACYPSKDVDHLTRVLDTSIRCSVA